MQAETALFKVLSDTTRLRLAVLLAIQGETCVCDLAQALGEPDFKISRHLSIMRSAGMVEARREGTWIHYRLAEARNVLEGCLQECFRDCLAAHPAVREDLNRFKQTACKKGVKESIDRHESLIAGNGMDAKPKSDAMDACRASKRNTLFEKRKENAR